MGLKGTLQVERGSKDGKHGYTVNDLFFCNFLLSVQLLIMNLL